MAAGPSDADDECHYATGGKTRMAGFFESLPPGFFHVKEGGCEKDGVEAMSNCVISGLEREIS